LTCDYYEILGVPPDASTGEIRTAWRTLARAWHPDRSSSERASFGDRIVLINEAWATLGNPILRRAYDARRRVTEPTVVMEAILRAARIALSASGWVWVGEWGHAETLEYPGAGRIAVSYTALLGSDELADWMSWVSDVGAASTVNCAVFFAARVLVPDQIVSSVGRLPVPGVAVDLIRSEAFGEFPKCLQRGLFGPLLRGDS